MSESAQPALDPFDAAFIADPFPTYERLRNECPVVQVDQGKGFWFVTRNDLVREAAADPSRFSSQVGSLAAVPPSPELLAAMKAIMPPDMRNVPTLLTLDPPGHTRNRRLVSRAFTPPKVKAFEATARAIAEELTDGWAPGTEVEFVRGFSVPLPVRVIAIGLDVPGDRVDDFKRWSDNAVAPIGARLSDAEMLEVTRSDVELRAFILDQIARKRAAEPAADVLSTLVHARLDDTETADLAEGTSRQLSDDEIVSIVRQLLVAGNETTTNLITQMMVRFADEPAWWARLRAEPALIPAAVEECLRLVTPSGVNQRKTACPVDLGGVTIPQGADVLISYQSANHDERTFPEPERFDPTRPNLGEHLAFGRGIHFCPGAGLARMEARVALEVLTQRVAAYEIVGRDALEWNETFQLRAVRRLTVRVTA